jgi:thioredoxin 1
MTDNTMQLPKAEHLTAENFDKTITESKVPVFVDFYAEWCGPCKLAAPIVDKLSAEYKGKVNVVKLDVDHANEISAKYGVRSIPTAMVFKDGKPVDELTLVGYSGEGAYRKMLEKVSGYTAAA